MFGRDVNIGKAVTEKIPKPTGQSQAETGEKARQPRQRRKDARPGEIIEAALTVFGERGFGATKLEDIARRAGVSKGTLFVYFSSKEELFKAVATTLLAKNLKKLRGLSADPDQSLSDLVPLLLRQAAQLQKNGASGILRLLIAESRTFPDLARVWHDEVVSKILGLLTSAIERAQQRGEICAGNAQLYAFSIMGPMIAGTLFREVLAGTDAPLPSLEALAEQHAKTVLHGLAMPSSPPSTDGPAHDKG